MPSISWSPAPGGDTRQRVGISRGPFGPQLYLGNTAAPIGYVDFELTRLGAGVNATLVLFDPRSEDALARILVAADGTLEVVVSGNVEAEPVRNSEGESTGGGFRFRLAGKRAV